MKKLGLKISLFAISSVLVCGIGVGDYFAAKNSNIITQYLCGFNVDESASKEARSKGIALAQEVEESGAVLLKNTNNVLPLKKDTDGKIKVNVFGVGSTDDGFCIQGTGSGNGSRHDCLPFCKALTEANIEYNTELYNVFASVPVERKTAIECHSDSDYLNIYGIVEASDSILTQSILNNAKAYSNTAIYVISRLMGEGNDFSKKQWVTGGGTRDDRKQQSLCDNEIAILEKIKNNFENVIVVLNCGNPMECGFATDEKVDSLFWIGMPGTRGALGFANLLKGETVTPSGRLSDTYAYDLSTAPSYANAGREGVGSYTNILSGRTDLLGLGNKFNDYAEDIYVGYKWYETADAEGYWDDVDNNYGKGYKGIVQFPFGYGLSYTTFNWEIESIKQDNQTISDGGTLNKLGNMNFNIKVTNTGSVKGADVVELYFNPPYTKGGIEKSSVNLVGYAKTKVLEPQESETIAVSFAVEDMKSYDCYDKNNNGFMGYELEEGNYEISLRTDSHTVKTGSGQYSFNFKVPTGGFKYERDTVTNEIVENRFTTFTNTISGATSTIKENVAKKAHSIDGSEEEYKVKYLSRNDFKATFPSTAELERTCGNNLKNDTLFVSVKQKVNDSDTFVMDTGSTKTHWNVSDMLGVDMDDPLWDELISQMPFDTMCKLIAHGGFGTIAVPEIGMPKTLALDGPSGFNNQVTGQNDLKATNYPCDTVIACTWDIFLAYQVGCSIAYEGTQLGITGWYGPGGNLHRTPLGGRNFEYYSEDPILSGYTLAYEILGAKEKGMTAYIKHFAVNDTDSGRNGAYKWLTEQNLRENYFKVFEIAVKVGKSNGLMSSIDRIGTTRVSGSDAALTGVLRKEWGFVGTVITDYYQSSGKSSSTDYIHDIDECVRAGNNLILHPDLTSKAFDDTESATAKNAIYNCAKQIVQTYVDTLDYMQNHSGMPIEKIGNGKVTYPWWIVLLVGVNSILVSFAVYSGFELFYFSKERKPKKRLNNVNN